jgi:hypothetical protein
MAKKGRKSKKDKKGKKRAAARRLPSAVQGLLQYLGGQDATLQQAPRPRGASGADGGETLTRYLAAKTAILEATKAAAQGASIAQQIEQQTLAKRQAEETEKKIGMLSVAATKTEASKKQLEKEIAQLKGSLQPSNLDWMSSIKNVVEYPLPSYQPSFGSRYTPSWAGRSTQYSGGEEMDEFEGLVEEPDIRDLHVEGSQGGGGYFTGGGGAAAVEMYLENAPNGRPIIRDKPRREPSVRLPSRVAPKAPEKVKTQISAADLKASISQVTGLAKSKYKLPSRTQYARVQNVLQRTSGSSADIISALKEAGVNIAEA